MSRHAGSAWPIHEKFARTRCLAGPAGHNRRGRRRLRRDGDAAGRRDDAGLPDRDRHRPAVYRLYPGRYRGLAAASEPAAYRHRGHRLDRHRHTVAVWRCLPAVRGPRSHTRIVHRDGHAIFSIADDGRPGAGHADGAGCDAGADRAPPSLFPSSSGGSRGSRESSATGGKSTASTSSCCISSPRRSCSISCRPCCASR